MLCDRVLVRRSSWCRRSGTTSSASGRNGDRSDRPLHRVHHPRLSCAGGRATAGTSREHGASGGTTSGSTSIAILWVAFITILFIFPLYTVGAAVERPVRLGVHELHGPVVRGHRPRLRRLVGAVREELVHGPGAHGHRGGARAARSRSGSASSRCRPKRRRPLHVSMRGAPRGAPRRSASRAATNDCDSAVRRSRSKCSLA